MNKPNPTKLEIATAIRKAVKKRMWGDIGSCPLCKLFCYDIRGSLYWDCGACRDAVFAGRSCCKLTPSGTKYTAEEYWSYEIEPKKRGPWRRAANRELLAIAERLEREHEAEKGEGDAD